MQKRELMYEGKAKSLYATDDENLLIASFRNDASAFDGTKKAKLDRKGLVNNCFNAHIMALLEAGGVATHFVKRLSADTSLVKKLSMIPVECVVRNRAAGSLCRRLGVEKGQVFESPLFEFFYKDDALHDPMITTDHILAFKWATAEEVDLMRQYTYRVNKILSPLFQQAGMLLVDFKLEFGRLDGQIVLGDEFSPDGCRLWDEKTMESMDKDRFRQDMGNVIEFYEEVSSRLGIELPSS